MDVEENTRRFVSIVQDGVEQELGYMGALNFSPEQKRSIAEALETNNALLSLFLCGSGIGEDHEAMERLAKSLKVNNTLKDLDLRSSKIGEEQAVVLAEALTVNDGIQRLNLSSPWANPRVGERGAWSIGSSLKSNCQLVILKMKHNNIGAHGAEGLADGLVKNRTLEELDLDHNVIGAVGMRHLCRALEVNDRLKKLWLNRNEIGEAARECANALKVNTTLEVLELGYNRVGPPGAEDLADALRTNTSLVELSLIGNGVRYGAGQFEVTLRENPTLKSLDLSYNEIGNGPVRAIAKAIQENTTLETLRLFSNPIGSDAGRALLASLDHNNTLVDLRVTGSELPTSLRCCCFGSLPMSESLATIIKEKAAENNQN